MDITYRLFGSEQSPYAIKVRSYFRYKRIPHEWLLRGPDTIAEMRRHTTTPLVPLVVTPEDEVVADSGPILERMEEDYPNPPMLPDDPALAVVARLVEGYGDEWVNKLMFHFRWWHEADRESAALRMARAQLGEVVPDVLQRAATAVRESMTSRLVYVGSAESTRPLLEASLERLLRLLDDHLATRHYLFGGRPACGDFGLFAQLHQCAEDPTGGQLVEAHAAVRMWIERMLSPAVEGRFDAWETLAPTLGPLLRREIAATYLPWAAANAEAVAAGRADFTVEIDGGVFTQSTQRYHATSFRRLRDRLAGISERADLDRILSTAGALRWLDDA